MLEALNLEQLFSKNCQKGDVFQGDGVFGTLLIQLNIKNNFSKSVPNAPSPWNTPSPWNKKVRPH